MAQGGGAVIRTAIITGGAGGMGQALDAGLRARGWHTVLIDLPGPALEALEPSADRRVVACDLTDGAAMRAVCGELRRVCASMDMVIYNAGITQIGPFDALSESAHRRVFEINYFAATNMARELLEDVRTARGIHLAMSSVAGFTPLIHRTAYGASKHALEGFFKSLRSDEKGYGVRCVIAAPSFVATNIGRADEQEDGTSRPGSASDGIDVMSPESAAEVILRGLERGCDFIPVGRMARMSYIVNRLSPSIYQRLMERKIKHR